MGKEETFTLAKEAMAQFAQEFVSTLAPSKAAQVVALHGDLGAGKTTLAQLFGAALGITEPITSPTFTLLKQYETTDDRWPTFLHMDAYRIDDESELRPLRFPELLAEPQALFCIEWAEKIASALPADTIHITLSIAPDERRIVQVSRP